jgi:chromosomal replication initiator protein
LKDIGEAFGGKDHGTVIHACKTVAAMMTADEEFRRTVSGIIEKVKRE